MPSPQFVAVLEPPRLLALLQDGGRVGQAPVAELGDNQRQAFMAVLLVVLRPDPVARGWRSRPPMRPTPWRGREWRGRCGSRRDRRPRGCCRSRPSCPRSGASGQSPWPRGRNRPAIGDVRGCALQVGAPVLVDQRPRDDGGMVAVALDHRRRRSAWRAAEEASVSSTQLGISVQMSRPRRSATS